MSQFKPPSQPGWNYSEPEQPQQEFPQQQVPRPFIQQLQPPPQPVWQETQYPPQPETYYPPPPQMPPPSPPKKRMRRNDKFTIWGIAALVAILVVSVIGIFAFAKPSSDAPLSPAAIYATATAVAIQSDAATAAAIETANVNTVDNTPVSQPTDTPVIQQTTIPTTPAPTFATFSDGTFQVGSDIQPGTYRTQTSSSGCYYARLKGFGGTTSDILANNLTDYPAIVTILPSDKGFISQNCGTWTTDLSQITTSKITFDGGMYLVGTDIAPGTYKNTASSGCYYARLRGFSNSTDNIIANNLTDAASIVTISASDKGFESTRCGTWTKI